MNLLKQLGRCQAFLFESTATCGHRTRRFMHVRSKTDDIKVLPLCGFHHARLVADPVDDLSLRGRVLRVPQLELNELPSLLAHRLAMNHDEEYALPVQKK